MRQLLVAGVLIFLATSVQAAAIPVGIWHFDEGSGLVASDSSGEALHGNILGATWTLGAQGPFALEFDGADMVEMGDHAQLEPATLTVAACLRSQSLQGTYTYIISEGLHGCVCPAYALFTNNSAAHFFTCSGTGASRSAQIPFGDVWDGDWHRVVATYDGDVVRIFLDGMAVGAPVAAIAPNYATSNHSIFSIGGLFGGCAAVVGFVGDIDEVGVWDGVLSDLEIETLGDCGHLMSDGFESVDTSAWALTIP